MSDRFAMVREATIHPETEKVVYEVPVPQSQTKEWVESENPLVFLNLHYLEQVEQKGYYKSTPSEAVASATPNSSLKQLALRSADGKRKVLHLTVSIVDILNIDPTNECFTIKYRTYMLWEVDLHELGLPQYAEKAIELGHYYPLNRTEVQHFTETCHLPNVALFNRVDIKETDLLDIRIYGGEHGRTAVLANQSFTAIVRARFVLHHFPFDLQNLTLDFKLHDARTWNMFTLSINSLQFYKDTFKQQEWNMFIPKVKKGAKDTNSMYIIIPVQRKSLFYVQNVFFILIVLSLLGLSTFAFPAHEIAGRAFINLTLILTLVAFKFSTIAGALPKVSYSTLMDHYMSTSICLQAVMTAFTIVPRFFEGEEHNDYTINLVLAMVSIAMIVIIYGTLGIISWVTLRAHYQHNALIPLEKDRPWYSFRFANPKHLVDLNPKLSFSETFEKHAAVTQTKHFKYQ
eukprot:gene1529-1619_t